MYSAISVLSPYLVVFSTMFVSMCQPLCLNSKILADKGIDVALVDFVVAEDAETMNNNINLLDRAFKRSVKAEVERRIGGAAPKKGTPVDKTLTKEDFMKMSFTELLELKRDNPELYQALSN